MCSKKGIGLHIALIKPEELFHRSDYTWGSLKENQIVCQEQIPDPAIKADLWSCKSPFTSMGEINRLKP